jgi:hypothetical protein
VENPTRDYRVFLIGELDNKSPTDLDVRTHWIVCDGMGLQIEDNLYEAFMTLPLSELSYIWIDALCINQDDFEERGLQVSLIGEVYSHAEQVTLWL